MKKKSLVSIVGCGAVGTTLAFLLAQKGYSITALFSRRKERARKARAFIQQGKVVSDPADAARQGEIVFITTPDDSIEKVARKIARSDGARKLNIQESGSLQNGAYSPDGSEIIFTRWRHGYNRGAADLVLFSPADESCKLLLAEGA